MEKARQAMKSDPPLAIDYFAESAELYMKAVGLFPPDEEKRLCMTLHPSPRFIGLIRLCCRFHEGCR